MWVLRVLSSRQPQTARGGCFKTQSEVKSRGISNPWSAKKELAFYQLSRLPHSPFRFAALPYQADPWSAKKELAFYLLSRLPHSPFRFAALPYQALGIDLCRSFRLLSSVVVGILSAWLKFKRYVEMSSMVGRCPEVTSRTDEGTDGTPPSESVDLRRQRGTTQEDEEMSDYDDEYLQQ
ncbi:hypothetical protein ACLB2K_004505 [Fragaria x ananassa]